MATKMSQCPSCSAALAATQVENVNSTNEAPNFTVTGLPVLQCTKGHRVPVHRDFMLWFIHELRNTHLATIPGGKAKGLVFKKYHCACGGEVGAKPERSESRTFELHYPDSPAFRVSIELALHKCASCGKEQVRSAEDLSRSVAGMAVRLNDSVGFPHSG